MIRSKNRIDRCLNIFYMEVITMYLSKSLKSFDEFLNLHEPMISHHGLRCKASGTGFAPNFACPS